MKDHVISRVLNGMFEWLSDEQLNKLNTVLYMSLSDCDIVQKSYELSEINDSWKRDLEDFLLYKKVEGKAERTLRQYKHHLYKLLSYYNKHIKNINDTDIFKYMQQYKVYRNISNRSLENMRLVFSSFFHGHLYEKGPMTTQC